MKTLVATVLFSISFIAEVAGILLLVHLAKVAKKQLMDLVALHTIDGGDPSGNTAGRDMGDGVEAALRNQVPTRLALALLISGIVAGSAANFLTLG